MTDIHSNADTCYKLAAAPGVKPKGLVIYGIGVVYIGWSRGLINERLDIISMDTYS